MKLDANMTILRNWVIGFSVIVFIVWVGHTFL